MIRLLLVGCGNIGTAGHLPALRALSDEGLVTVTACDADPARAQAAGATFGVPWATDWTVAADGADAVAVCLPPGPNAEVAAAAARRGLHVLCEKPPGRTSGDAATLAAAQHDSPGVVTMIGFNRRFNPLYQRAMAASLELGPPTSFYGRFSLGLLGSPPDDTAPDWIVSSSAHAIDLAVATMGYPTAVSVSRRSLGAGPDNAWTVQMHGSGGGAVLFLNYAAGRRVERFEWAGPGYDTALDLPNSAEWAQSGRPVERWDAADKSYPHAFGFTDEYRCFLRAVAGDGPRPACDFAYGAAFMNLVETILGTDDGCLSPVAAPVAQEAGARQPAAAAPAVPMGRPRARPVVLLHQPFAVHHRFFAVETLAHLRTRCDVRLVESPDDPLTWKDASVVVTGRAAKRFPADLAEWAPDLELVVAIGASVRNLAPERLVERGVVVCNTADAVAQSVAEHCLLLTLAGLRRLPQTDQAMHRGEWPRPQGAVVPAAGLRARVGDALPLPVRAALGRLERRLKSERARRRTSATAPSGAPGAGGRTVAGEPPPASDLRGQVVGLVGWGHTARRFAELLRPFGCVVLVATESGDPDELAAVGARRASLGELLAGARVVSLHQGLTDETARSFGENQLALLRPGTVLVNTARGELIDEDALLARLAGGDIVAALDVFAEEPLPASHPLRALTNVILTPHHASTTVQEERRMGDQALATVLAWLDGRPVDGIGRDRLGRMT